ncbi:MAG: FHA domain-containing protein [Anaerolineae bacterium]
MNRVMQIYYNTVFGALGGLIAWLAVGSVATGTWNIWLAYMFVGAGVGLCIGIATGSVSGAIIQRSFRRALVGAGLGGLAGLVGGLLGLLLGEVLFLVAGGGILGRSLGWMLLGLLIGAGEGLLSRRLRRASYGAVGGALGGLLGGLIYETITELYLNQSESVQVILGGLGLILIGAFIGSLIPISVEVFGSVLGKGTLQVMNGKRKELTVSVIDSTILGSSDSCDVYLPGDPGIARRHAVVYTASSKFYVRDLNSGTGTSARGQPVPNSGAGLQLHPGDQIQLGQTLVMFR